MLITGEPTKDSMYFLSDRTAYTIDEIILLNGNTNPSDIYAYWKHKLTMESPVSIEKDAITWKWVIVQSGKIREWFVDAEIKLAKNKAIRSRFEFSEKKK